MTLLPIGLPLLLLLSCVQFSSQADSSTTLQLTSHFFPCLFLYLVKLEVHRIVELFAGMSEHTNASLAWHDMNPKFKQTVHSNFHWLLDERCISLDQKAVLVGHTALLSLWMSVWIAEMRHEWHGNVVGATGRAGVKAQFWHGSESHLIRHVTHLHRCHKAVVIPLGLYLSHRLARRLSFHLLRLTFKSFSRSEAVLASE